MVEAVEEWDSIRIAVENITLFSMRIKLDRASIHAGRLASRFCQINLVGRIVSVPKCH